ncbi:HECT-like ubiquitin-conjugating enzyme-binding-domain-containing protein [Coprinopsis sp. MPI-PUGE-AT-0042]|nr:HECT-like ubiquitin-conjugating enzyme-binding-domain-containing protein [Coprinopsis sp. MPI-PUGE-AT-0042]
MPTTPASSSVPQFDLDSSSSALQTLLSNLRTQSGDDMLEISSSNNNSNLLVELRKRVGELAPTMVPQDAKLANSLVTLLSYFERVSAIQSGYAGPDPSASTSTQAAADAPPPIDVFDALTRHLNTVQVERLTSQLASSSSSTTNAQVESAILWSQIDKELESVVSMCKDRTDHHPRFYPETQPPQYDYDEEYHDYDEMEDLPVYDGTGRISLDGKSMKTNARSDEAQGARINDEKMRIDLEGVVMAIDRLYLVAPQLHNQRVELKSSKQERLAELAKNREVAFKSQKGKERDVKELETIIDMLGKASERKLKDQAVVLEGGMERRLEKARQKDLAKRDAFVEGLIMHSGAGRMHGQDAILQPRVRDPQAMLTLPEFIKENVPADSDLLRDPSVMLTLPEFVAQSIPPENMEIAKGKKSRRSRSLSAPPLAWLRQSRSLSNLSSSSKGKNKETTFDVVFVAENHENLNHVLVFFTVTKQLPGAELVAEVLPPFPEHTSEGGDHLIIRSGHHSSLPLILPARTTPGKKEIRAQSGHYEVKLGTLRPSVPAAEDAGSSPLLDAPQLSAASPSSFACSSCSLPIVYANRISSYRDLPSEHWEELVEAWMCHTDQKLHDQVMRHGKAGFWPKADEAFVGGSYILFESAVMAQQNLLVPQDSSVHENWKLCRCLCGAVVGRSQPRPSVDNEEDTTCFRIVKYAIRPVTTNPNDNLQRIPLSAFIVEDMMEFVQAHASYRFVIRDEEEEKPRILIWLFKPRMRLSYTTPRARTLPKTASITAAKVLYKLIGPADAAKDIKSLLNKYPGFPQAEYLSYPMTVCHRLAALLKESSAAYPENLRTMTGLQVGWLSRR